MNKIIQEAYPQTQTSYVNAPTNDFCINPFISGFGKLGGVSTEECVRHVSKRNDERARDRLDVVRCRRSGFLSLVQDSL